MPKFLKAAVVPAPMGKALHVKDLYKVFEYVGHVYAFTTLIFRKY